MDKEKDPILKLRRMEGKLLLLDLKKIIWVAPLSWLMMFISLASLLFSEHQSDWKWNISSVTKSIIPFAKQVWADAADHVRPGCSDPLTCLLTFLTLNAAIVVVIVLEGKSRVKGTIELFFLSIYRNFRFHTGSHRDSDSMPDRGIRSYSRSSLHPVHLGLVVHIGECQ